MVVCIKRNGWSSKRHEQKVMQRLHEQKVLWVLVPAVNNRDPISYRGELALDKSKIMPTPKHSNKTGAPNEEMLVKFLKYHFLLS